MEKNYNKHWNKVYNNNDIDKLGWFEENPVPSLQLIEKCNFNKDAYLLNVGSGATTLVDELLEIGYNNIIANDLSSIALEKLRSRLGVQKSSKVKWVVDDLTNPMELTKLTMVQLWHDRAALHFFTNENDQNTYFNLLKKLVALNGFVIIAAFNLSSAIKCSGLAVYRYDEHMLQDKLGNDFVLIESFNYEYTMPSGDKRSYIYTLFKRVL